MLDVFDIIVAEIPADSRIRVVRESSAYGERDENRLVWCDVPLARTTDPEWSRAICGVREPWNTYSVDREARAAAEDDERWERFLGAVRDWLSATSDWCALVESDCDQHPRERVVMTSTELVERLDSQRRLPTSPLALIVSKR